MTDYIMNVDTGHYVLSPSVTTNSGSVTTTTTHTTVVGTGTSGTGTAGSLSNKDIENAVYAHIQAVRALGRTTINTVEISNALGLPQNVVDGTIDALKKKGIKVAG